MNTPFRNAVTVAAFLIAGSSFASGKLSVSRAVVVDRPPATVWKLLGDYNALDVWLPPVRASALASSTLHGSGTTPGAVRVLDLGGNARVTEKLVAYHDHGHRYSVAVVESPLPVKNHVATIELHPAPNGKTLVRWHATFDARGASDAQAREAIEGIYDAGLKQVAAIFRKATPP
jgi:mxaD protein